MMLSQVPSSTLPNVHNAAERPDIEANFSSGLILTLRELFLGSGHEQPIWAMEAGRDHVPLRFH